MDLNFDSQSYNIALIIIIGSIVFFALFVIAGQYMFVKSNISRRTEELALYRSLGYKSNQLFYIIFAEYFLIGIISIAVGTNFDCITRYITYKSVSYESCGQYNDGNDSECFGCLYTAVPRDLFDCTCNRQQFGR